MAMGLVIPLIGSLDPEPAVLFKEAFATSVPTKHN